MRLTPDGDGALVDVGGRSLHVHTDGEPLDVTAPLLVLIHGVGHGGAVWRPLAEHFASRGWAVLSVDLPGHGKSGGEPPDTIAAHADIIVGLIEATPRRRAHVVGHSMGGVIALELAASRPELIEVLVIVSSAAALPVNALLLDATRDADPSALDLIDRWSHSRDTPQETRDIARALMSDVGEGVLHTSLLACDRYETGVAAAQRVTAPTLIVTGEHDVMIDSGEVARLELALQDATTEVIHGVGHNVVTEAPDVLIAAIEDFLDAQASSG